MPEPETQEGHAVFTYDPHPDVGEQRELRREYRALLATAQNTRRHLPESSLSDLNDMVRVGDELYNKVKAPTDGLLDSRFLLNLSDMGAEMIRQMRVETDAFDMDEYLHTIARYIGGHVSHTQSRAHRDDEETQFLVGDVEQWNWEKLGRLAARHTHRAPVSEHLLGPLQAMPRQRKVARTSRLVPEGEQVAPQQLDREDMTESENETSRLVLAIARRLEECSGENGVPLFPFALNPHSFSDSVENLFYISFLIRDGKAAIIDEEDSDPMLLLSEEPTDEDRQAGLTRRQIVFELDMPLWRDLLQLYDIQEPMIPTRTVSTSLPSSSGWYS